MIDGARLFLPFAALALAGCDIGARTGLTIPDWDAGPDAPADGGPDSPDSPVICVPGEFPLEPTRADVVFTIDRSGSMRFTIDGMEGFPPELWRWRFLRDALDGAFDSLDPRVNVGAKFYPEPSMPMDPPDLSCRTAAGIDVPIAASSRDAIIRVFDTTEPVGGTPTALAIAESSAALRASPSRRDFIVLATDGGPNCNGALMFPCTCTSSPMSICAEPEGQYSCLDSDRTVSVIDQTFRIAGIPVFVVGIEDPTRPDLGDVMDDMAIAGGRPREGTGRRFYSVRTAAELSEALDVIVSTISACGFVSPSVPADESTFSITLDGEEIPRSSTDGWAWSDRATGELELSGSWCDRAQEPGATVVAIVDDCPE